MRLWSPVAAPRGRRAALVALVVAAVAPSMAHAQVYTVNSSADASDATPDGSCATAASVCTFRAALEEASNGVSTTSTIRFASTFNGEPADQVLISRPLESTGSVDIIGDGCATNPVNQPCVWIGYSSPSTQPALRLQSTGLIGVRGLAIGNAGTAIDVADGSSTLRITNNWLGVALSGSLTPNIVGVSAGRATDLAISSNAIAGGLVGISVPRLTFRGISVAGNRVGVDPRSGQRIASPSLLGISVGGSGFAGPEPTVLGNTVSMDSGIGIDLAGASARGNFVGTDPAGRSLGGGDVGIRSSTPETIQSNTVGNFAVAGIAAEGGGEVYGNFVGTDSSGRRLGGGGVGIRAGGVTGGGIGPGEVSRPGAVIGGVPEALGAPASGQANTISFNAGSAISVVGAENDAVLAALNFGNGNGKPFVDLSGDGPGNGLGINRGIGAPRITGASGRFVTGFARRGVSVLVFTASPESGSLIDLLGAAVPDQLGRWKLSYSSLPANVEVAALQVENVDGRRSSELATRSIDRDPPQTSLRITRVSGDTRRVRIRATEPNATFKCAVDRQAFRACDRTVVLRNLDLGRHRVRAIATDASGNSDPTPALRRFRITRR